MSEFISVAKVGEIPQGKGRVFQVAGREIAVFHVDGRYFALDEYCPHMGAPLSEGDIHGDAVLCQQHLWAFKLADGSCVDVPSLCAETFEVCVEDDEIRVRVSREDRPPGYTSPRWTSRRTPRARPRNRPPKRPGNR